MIEKALSQPSPGREARVTPPAPAMTLVARTLTLAAGATPVRSRPFSDLANRREGSRDQQLIFLAKRAHAALWRPRPTGRAGLSADAVPLDGVLIGPDVNELVQPTQFACPACGQWRQLLAR